MKEAAYKPCTLNTALSSEHSNLKKKIKKSTLVAF